MPSTPDQTSQAAFLKSLQGKINKTDFDPKAAPSGRVTSVGDGVALVEGLGDVGMGEIVTIGADTPALALNLGKDSTGCVILGDTLGVKQGAYARSTGQLLSIPASDKFLGRVVNVLGEPIDGQGSIASTDRNPLEKVAPGVMTRQSVDTPLQTGIKAIDAMIPIGRGQRELIIGDKSTGKTAVALTTMINQKDTGVINVYVAIGQKRSQVSQIVSILDSYGAMDNTIIVSASASDPAAQQFIAPYAGTALAEYFLDRGKDVLIIYDDLSKHAWAYREISLLLRRPSGREAYPGDVFYLHSRLLERACRLDDDHGGGSITALPIIETQANDVSAYIPTNVISITDGQIYLEADLFNAGQRPAINVGLSVSRVGSSAQIKAMKKAAGQLRLDLAQFRSLEAFTQFSSDLDPKTKAQIDRGQRLTQILKQHWENPMPVQDQIIVIWAATNGYLDDIKLEHISTWEPDYIAFVHKRHPDIIKLLKKERQLSDQSLDLMKQALTAFNQDHPEWHLPKDTD